MNTCPSCGATLENVGDIGDTCPHCGYNLADKPLGSNVKGQQIGEHKTVAPAAQPAESPVTAPPDGNEEPPTPSG